MSKNVIVALGQTADRLARGEPVSENFEGRSESDVVC